MKNRVWITSAVMAALLVMAAVVAPLQSFAAAHLATSAVNTEMATAISGQYSGVVKLNGTASGVYSDTLTVPAPPAGSPAPPDLGSIDLALNLSETVNAVNGYVSLDKTLVFSAEHTLAGTPPLAVGPYVAGSFDGTHLVLTSELLSAVVAGRGIKRQFRLTGTIAADDPNMLRGEYRETLWGYARLPITVLGTFALKRPPPVVAANTVATAVPTATPMTAPTTTSTVVSTAVAPTTIPSNSIRMLYLPLIRR